MPVSAQYVVAVSGAAFAISSAAAIGCAGYFHLYNLWHHPPSIANQRWHNLLLGNDSSGMRSGVWALRLFKVAFMFFLTAFMTAIVTNVLARWP
jgi:hypothetical protein